MEFKNNIKAKTPIEAYIERWEGRYEKEFKEKVEENDGKRSRIYNPRVSIHMVYYLLYRQYDCLSLIQERRGQIKLNEETIPHS